MSSPEEIHFCPRCATPVILAERFNRLRPVCPACGWIYFTDPKVAVAALIEQNGQVLLVQRANEPFRGLWTLPAGFLDAGEDPPRAVERECKEETGLVARAGALAGLLSGQEYPGGADLLIVYKVEILSGQLTPGDDASAAAFFPLAGLPDLAFSTTLKILRHAL